MIHLYGLIVGIAIVVGWSIAERIEPRVNKIAPWVLVMGLIGARVWHIVDMWGYYGQNLASTWRVWEGGMSIWGGLIGGMAAYQFTIYNLQFTKTEKWNILGAMVTALPLAQAVGRLGNGVNREFVNKVLILPWWAMEAVLDLMLFLLLWSIRSRADDNSPLQGMMRVFVYLMGYGLIRLVLQPYR